MTAATAGGFERPPLKHTVKLDGGGELEIKMSYGLFNDLQRTTPDPAAVLDTMLADPYTRDYVIRRCLTQSNKMITDPDKDLIPPEEVDLADPDEIEKLLSWVSGHLLYFFAISAGGLRRLGEAFKANLNPEQDQSAPSTSGSPS